MGIENDKNFDFNEQSKPFLLKSKVHESQKTTDTEDQSKDEEIQLNYKELFRFANFWDYSCLFLGTLSAMVHGVAMPVLFIFFGDLTDSFVDYGKYSACNFSLPLCIDEGLVPENTTQSEFDQLVKDSLNFQSTVARQSVIFSILALAVWVFGWGQVTFWNLQASRQINRIRVAFFRSILRQEIGYFDINSTGELNTRLADDVNKITDGMNDKVALVIMNLSRALGGLVIGFVYSWKVALVILACSPLIGVLSAILFKLIESFSKKENTAYAKAGGIAEEVISSIRTIAAFGGQQIELARYVENLDIAKAVGIRKGLTAGAGAGSLMFVLFLCMD